MIHFLISFFFLFTLFQASAKITESQGAFNAKSNEATEAFYSFDKTKSEFCCDREYTHETFYEMSKEQSNRIVQNLLSASKTTPFSPAPARKGQR